MLKVSNLKKSFEDKPVLEGFSYDFPEVGAVAVLGESGVGKTTLLRLISGLDTEFSGEIEGGGIGKCSYAFQESRLFPSVSALDNLLLTVFREKSEKNKKTALAMLSSLGIENSDANLFPSELSGGMKQRVSLARAFLKDAPILLLDEPTKELDSDNRELVLDEIERQSEKRLVILVTHNENDAQRLSAEILRLN